MRLSRLDLTRYGRFTDFRLDFGPLEPGRPDLHIVYGPNEAGKSTTFAAYLDLLFGIGGQSPYGFLHPYKTMRIGGLVDLGGVPREIVRIKRQQATLLDAAGRALDEGIVAAELGGIGRDAYRTMFSLDDDTLEEGGRSILQSRGDLGQLLFQGSAGLAGLGRTLEALHEEADRFHKSNAHKTGLKALRDRLDALKDEREAIDVEASAYRQMVAERDRAETAYAEALAARGGAQARRDEIGRLLAALPRLADLRATRDALRPLLALPEPPAAWAEELPALARDELRLDTERHGIAQEIATLEEELRGISVDEAALRLAPEHESLAELRARAITAGEDLPRRRPLLLAAEAAVAAALRRIGRPAGEDPESLMLDAATVGTLRELVAGRSGVAERSQRAREEAEDARRDSAAAAAALRDAGGEAVAGPALIRLAATAEALRVADPAIRLAAAERACADAAETLAEALAALRPWAGTADRLAALTLPERQQVEGWAQALAEAEVDAKRRDEEAQGFAAERDDLAAEVDALGRIAGVVGEAQAASIRAGRERAWAEHRAKLDAPSADRFEDALRRDDAVMAARFGQAGDVARLKEASLKLASLETRLRRAEERGATARLRADAPRASLAAARGAIDPPLPPDMPPATFGLWLGRTAAVLRARGTLRAAERDHRDAARDLAGTRDRLGAALTEAGIPFDAAAPLEQRAVLARAAIDRGRLRDGLATTATDRARRTEARDVALAKAEAAERRWNEDWAAACRGCWLGADGSVPSVSAVAEVLEVLGALAPELATRADLRYRIAAMEADEAAFAARVAPLAEALGIEPGEPTQPCSIPQGSEAGLRGSSHATLLRAPTAISASIARCSPSGEVAGDEALIAVGTLRPDHILTLDRAAGRRIGEAREAEAARRRGGDNLAKARERRARAEAALVANQARGAVMRDLFGVESLAEVGLRLQDVKERERLRRAAEAAERDIRAGLRLPGLAGIEDRLDGIDTAALEVELGVLDAGLPGLDGAVQDLYARRDAASATLDRVGGDGAVARIEAERRVVLLDIEDQARSFIRLRGGVAAAEEALRVYRDRHRSGMLKKASEAFEIISRRAYRGLAAQPGDKGEVLMAVPAEGQTKEASDLSKGTRFQLYLALRVAGYHEFVRHRGAVPFVADDIMETFDDFRAEEAFRLFADMAEVGQVIYLTHHRHLIEIARSACPGVHVHELPPPRSGAAPDLSLAS